MNFIQHVVNTMENENFNAKLKGRKHPFPFMFIFKEDQIKLCLVSSQL